MSYVSFSCRLASIALFLGAIANADVFYTDQSTFEANAGALTKVDFTGIVADDAAVNKGMTFTHGGLTFSDLQSRLFIIGPNYGPGYTGLKQPVLNENTSPGTLTVALPSGTTAAGLQIGTNSVSGVMTIMLSDGSTTTFTAAGYGSLAFIGFTAGSAVSSFTLTTSNLSQFQTPLVEFAGNMSATPEPRYYAVLLCGLLGLAGARWRYRTR